MAKATQYCFRRYEMKYFLTPMQYRTLTDALSPHMQPDEYEYSAIGNIYYDTEDWYLIRASIEKPIYKQKLRLRAYGMPGNADTVFAELKKKYDGVVYKRRVSLPAGQANTLLLPGAPALPDGQISREIRYFCGLYRPRPRVFIGYDRRSLVGRNAPDLRVTFDTNLRYRTDALDLRAGAYGYPLLPDDRILMELKIPGVCPLRLARLLSELEIRPTSFSKFGAFYRAVVHGQGERTLPYSDIKEAQTSA